MSRAASRPVLVCGLPSAHHSIAYGPCRDLLRHRAVLLPDGISYCGLVVFLKKSIQAQEAQCKATDLEVTWAVSLADVGWWQRAVTLHISPHVQHRGG